MVAPVIILGGVAIGTAVVSAFTQTRAGSFKAEVGGESLDAYEIYQRIHFGPGTAKLKVAEEACADLAGRYIDRIGQITALSRKMTAAWQGTSADNAMTTAQQFTKLLAGSHTPLKVGKAVLVDQAGSFNEVYNKVDEVPKDPPKSNLLNDINPFPTDTDRKINEYNEKASKNVAAYTDYYGVSTANSAQMPRSFPVAPEVQVPPITVRNSDGGGITLPGGGGAGGRSGAGSGFGGGNVPLFTPDATSPTDNLTGQDGVPEPAPSRPSQDGVTQQQGWTPDQTANRPVGTGGNPSGPTASGGGIPGTAVGLGGGAVPGRAGGGAGRPGASGGGAPGARGGGGQPGAGLRSGAGGGPGGAAPHGQPGRGAAAPGAHGGLGAGGVPIGAGAGRDKEEDEERRRKSYLSGPDPYTFFGSDEALPPPIFGVD